MGMTLLLEGDLPQGLAGISDPQGVLKGAGGYRSYACLQRIMLVDNHPTISQDPGAAGRRWQWQVKGAWSLTISCHLQLIWMHVYL